MSSPESQNPFEKLGEQQRPPAHIRQKVMASAKFGRVMMHVLDLFISKPVATIGVLFKHRPGSNNPK